MRFLPPRILFSPTALLLASLWAVSSGAFATDAELHRQDLASALRQLEILDRFVARVATTYPLGRGERYHFDHERLRADLQRIRSGIHDYLTPRRAQPRERDELFGDYLLSGHSVDAQATP